MSSSREVTAQKKKDVWEEAGSEFYTESYPSGSKPPNNTHQRRPSRLGIPLPSHTARRGSLLHGHGRHNHKTGARRLPNNTTGAGLTFNSTMAAVDANGTTTNANDIQVAILPDLSEETILNERKTWEELMRIKSMPVPMAQKKLLKAQLANLPKLRLKGWANVKFSMRKSWKNYGERLIHYYRHTVFLHDSLRTIELRSGTAVVNVFLLIKWTLFLNLAISMALLIFIIGPYITQNIVKGPHGFSPSDPLTCKGNSENETNVRQPGGLTRLLDCCQALYEKELGDANVNRGTVSSLFRALGMGNIELWPISVGFYHESIISYDKNGAKYAFSVMYVLTGCAIFVSCLILIVYNMAQGVKEIINLREGEFYKYSNLIFAGWEHYTNDEAGAKFKRLLLRNEMKIALQTEKKKINDLMKTKRQRFNLYFLRTIVNVGVLVLLISASYAIFYVTTRFSIDQTRSITGSLTDKVKRYAEGFAPSIVIAFFNLIFPIILAKLGKFEQLSREWETALVLLRALFIRVFSLYSVGLAFYKYSYCIPKKDYCTTCDPVETSRDLLSIGSDPDSRPDHRALCWEAQFADQMYRIILTELLVKTLLTFIVDPFRRLIKYCFKHKLAQRIGTLSFNIIRHSLDVIYIQVLSWMSFHNAPFAPIIAVVYCFLIFYIKKFSVLHNCKYVPDTFKTTKTTAVFMMAKIISFVVVFFTYAYTVGHMVPSRECGPFRGLSTAWSTVQLEFKNHPALYKFFIFASSPGVAIPVALILILLVYYYYSVAQANRALVETLRHLLILEGHDKQYLFAKLNSLRRGDSDKTSVFKSTQLSSTTTSRNESSTTTTANPSARTSLTSVSVSKNESHTVN